MSRYRQLHCKVWNDSKFLELSDDAKLLWFQLLTSYYSNQIGLYKAPLPALAAEINWKTERVSKGFRELFQKGFLSYDEKVSLIFIKNFIRYNPPPNPNVIRSWTSLIDELPESPLIYEWIQIVREHLKGFSEPFQKAFQRVTEILSKGFEEPFGKGMPKQEQEQEYIIPLRGIVISAEEHATDDPHPPSPDQNAQHNHNGKTCPHDKIIELYHRTLPELPQVKVWNEPRRRYLQARWREDKARQNLDWWQNFFNIVKQSPFLMGQVKHWRANLEWLLRPSNFAKVLDGVYNDPEQNTLAAWQAKHAQEDLP